MRVKTARESDHLSDNPGKRLHQCLELSVADRFTAALMDAVQKQKQAARKVESSLLLKQLSDNL